LVALELVPTATIIALLLNPANPNAESQSRDIEAVARRLGLQLPILSPLGGPNLCGFVDNARALTTSPTGTETAAEADN
jgi:hypothetical protein